MKSIYIPIAMLLIGIGLLLGPQQIDIPTDWLNKVNPANWIQRGPATVCIVEETKDRTSKSVTAGQISVLSSPTLSQEIAAAGGEFLGIFDQDIKDRDKKVPTDLAPYLEAAKAVKLPALVIMRSGKFTAIPLPESDAAVLEALK